MDENPYQSPRLGLRNQEGKQPTPRSTRLARLLGQGFLIALAVVNIVLIRWFRWHDWRQFAIIAAILGVSWVCLRVWMLRSKNQKDQQPPVSLSASAQT
jgi:hypothetical protein